MTVKVDEDGDILFTKTGFLQKLYDKAQKTIGEKSFGKLSTEKAVERLFGLDLWKTIPEVDPEGVKIKKCLETAMKLKDEGNAFYKEGNLGAARDKYTQSLQHFPVDLENPEKNSDYAVILANRSATLDVPGCFLGCAQDIDRALANGYPKKLHHKVS